MLFRPSQWQEKESSASFSNLPVPLTQLIGRDSARADVVAALKEPNNRLLTLHGTGGVGKTRLAIAVASDLTSHFVDGVYFISLENLTRTELLPATIAQVLEIYTFNDETALDVLTDYMSDMRALLVLDNFEQVLSAAPLLTEILTGCAHLKLLVTSRSRLNVRGEQVFTVEPLELPSTNHKIKLAEAQQSPAVQLFIERARSVNRDFALDEANARALVDLCAHLDGLPLAIELAAARSNILSPKAMLARLDKRLQLLTGGPQDLPLRQQTIRNMIAWSYVLLTPAEQSVFRSLAVFAGGCTLEAIEAVGRAADVEFADRHIEVLDVVSSLISQSLVRITERQGEELRVSMLETVREYALEMLQQNNGEDLARQDHAEYYLKLAESAEPYLISSGQARWLDILRGEYANIRAALNWCVAEVGEQEDDGEIERDTRLLTGLRLAGALKRFWEVSGHIREGQEWLSRLLALTPTSPTPAREKALGAMGRLALSVSDITIAKAAYGEALTMSREQGNNQGISAALLGIANVYAELGDEDGALRSYEESLAISNELGNKAGISAALNNIALVHLHRDAVGEAIELWKQSLQLTRELEDQERLGVILNNLSRAYLAAGNPAKADEYVNSSLEMALELGQDWNIAYDLLTVAAIAGARNDHKRAAMVLSAADAAYDGFVIRLDRHDVILRSKLVEEARKALGEDAFSAAWTSGLALSPDEAAKAAPDLVLSSPARAIGSTAVAALSSRETEVLRLVAQGLSDPEMAAQLILSRHTINAHLKNIYSKLNVTSRAAATRYAFQNSLI